MMSLFWMTKASAGEWRAYREARDVSEALARAFRELQRIAGKKCGSA